MLTNIFLDVIKNVWPMVFIFTVILVLVRLEYLFINKKKFVFYREFIMLCFIIYILFLYYIVTFQDNNYGTNNFVPFKEIFRYHYTSRLFIKNVLGNIFLFIPFGIFVTRFIKTKKILPTVIVSIIVSCAIEYAQARLGRTADIDDVILNTFGGFIGAYLYKFDSNILNKMPKFMRSEIFLDFLSLTLLVTLIYMSFRYNFWRILAWIT